MYKRFVKRFLDIVLSAVLIVILMPIFFIVALYVWLFLGTPIIFSQERIGMREKTFKMYKFRSMTNEKDDNGNLLEEHKRMTKAGAFLRSTSLDELPELFCILIGKMSFVGPRPLPTYYAPYFFEEERKRHTVRGGLIPPDGLCGETIPSWEVQLKYDVEYAQNVSFLMDIRVILATFNILFKRVKSNYGAEERPHLNQYRKNMKAGD